MNCVSSKIKINAPKIKQLSHSSITALEQTLDALNTDVKQAQVMPFGHNIYNKNGKEIHHGGNMQNDNTFPDYSNSSKGKVSLITSTPYARRLYFHPEYNFSHDENASAQGNWLEPWITGERKNFCKKTFAKFYKREAGL